VVAAREPLWQQAGELPVMSGLKVDERELLLTTVVRAVPDVREPGAEPSLWPFWAAMAVTILFVGTVFSPWALYWGSVPVAIALIGWFWPRSARRDA